MPGANLDQFEIDSATYVQHAVRHGFERAENHCGDMSPSHGWEAAFTDEFLAYFRDNPFHRGGRCLVERFDTREEGVTGSDIRIEFHNAHKNQTFQLFLQIKMERYDFTTDVQQGRNAAIAPTDVFDFKYRSRQNHRYQIMQLQGLAHRPGTAAAFLVFRPQRHRQGHLGRPLAYMLPVENFQKGLHNGPQPVRVPLTDDNVTHYDLGHFRRAFNSRITLSADGSHHWRPDALAWYLYRTSESGGHH